MGYPAAYRAGAGDYVGGKAFKPPSIPKAPKIPPFVPDTIPRRITPNPANLPGLAARGAGQVLPRLVGRVVPWLGVGLAAWELWNWWQSEQTVSYPGFTMTCSTPGPCGYDATAAFAYSWACPLVPCTEASWQYLTVPNDVSPSAEAFGVFNYNEVINPETSEVVARVGVQMERWERNPDYIGDWVPEGEVKVWAPLPLTVPVTPPWVDPFELPIGQPVPNPQPPPWREATPDPNEPEGQPTDPAFKENPNRRVVVTPTTKRTDFRPRWDDEPDDSWIWENPEEFYDDPLEPEEQDEDDSKTKPKPRRPLPWLDPWDDDKTKPKPKVKTPAEFDPDVYDDLPPVLVIPPGSPPVVVETVVITETGVTFAPPNETRTKPGEREKEKKIFIRAVVGNGVLNVINLFTESLDFIDVLWKSIPEKLRPFRKRGDYTGKLEDIWDHLEAIPVDEVVQNFVNNQFEDWLFALGSSQVAQASRQVGLTTGLDRATRLGGDFAAEANPEGPPIPELYIDPVTGEWSIIAGGLDPVIIAQGRRGGNGTIGDLFGD